MKAEQLVCTKGGHDRMCLQITRSLWKDYGICMTKIYTVSNMAIQTWHNNVKAKIKPEGKSKTSYLIITLTKKKNLKKGRC